MKNLHLWELIALKIDEIHLINLSHKTTVNELLSLKVKAGNWILLQFDLMTLNDLSRSPQSYNLPAMKGYQSYSKTLYRDTSSLLEYYYTQGQGYFCPLLFSPFYTFKWFYPVLNLPKCSCVRDIICVSGIHMLTTWWKGRK